MDSFLSNPQNSVHTDRSVFAFMSQEFVNNLRLHNTWSSVTHGDNILRLSCWSISQGFEGRVYPPRLSFGYLPGYWFYHGDFCLEFYFTKIFHILSIAICLQILSASELCNVQNDQVSLPYSSVDSKHKLNKRSFVSPVFTEYEPIRSIQSVIEMRCTMLFCEWLNLTIPNVHSYTTIS